ncbi:acyl-CoA dehydrogenase family protein 9 [Diaminobutyricimonas aerilata]|uniref:Acyl-CoA dehydrogenase family protein 9 n=1 Tax=Diaminobutyricimonas aerilata TaxID=1162967 RepID=A0A2M9CIJ4_9MICO|nr:acyl-CoA dehydrogenase family protein [Diaminobutyricimonas aerilata]PJJ71690.1 acyl-CoA dehydrogenase family protein 9 [Diaminobutyricimonas aerilata]
MTSVDRTPKPSFTKSLFLGQVQSELVMPYPLMTDGERAKVDAAVASAREFLTETYDPWKAEREGWVGDDTIRELGERKLTGLFVDEKYGGLGLSQSGYCRVMEEFGRVDASLSVVMGVHQSIGTKPLFLYGTDEQKERWLPDLAAGRKLAAFVLTEPNVGSDAYNLETWAERQFDGSWLLNGEKRWIGNGDKDVLTVFARSDLGHVALIVEKGMDGLETGPRFDTLGLRANHLQRVRFTNVRVPAENLLGEPGDGFRIAMNTLNNGRMSMGTSISGGMKRFLELALEHTTTRRQFDREIIDFELVEDKLAWMEQSIYGLESTSYLTTGMVDAGTSDFSLESAMTKVVASDVGWYALNRAFQVHGGTAFMNDHPLAKALRDFRIFPIFEGSNDVMRAYVALNGLKALSEDLPDVASLRINDPLKAVGVLAPYVSGRINRRIRPDKLRGAHPAFARQVNSLSDQTTRLRDRAEAALRKHGKRVQERQLIQKRLADAASGIYAQAAVIGRASAVFERDGADASGAEKTVAMNFLKRTERQVGRALRSLEVNDDRFVAQIGRTVREDGGYGFRL